MIDKERLERIKNNYSVGIHILSGKPSVAITKENFEWLIEQAEKVEQLQREIEELEQENEMFRLRLERRSERISHLEDKLNKEIFNSIRISQKLNSTEKQLQQAKAKAERYEKVLEFYADEETYETKFATDTDEIYDPFTLIELDEGKKARRALEGKE